MRVLVAGGTGVLGRRAVPVLVGAGHDVVVVSRRPDSDRALRAAGAEPIRLDILDPSAVAAAAEGADAVVNLATHVPGGARALARRSWRTNDSLRRDASRALADAAIETGARFVQESFAPTYPDRGTEWIEEEVPLAPADQTGTVVDAEASAARVTAGGGIGVVLRFGFFYGQGVGDWVAFAAKGWFMLPGPAERLTSMVFIDDAASAVLTALTLPTGTYNVVDDEPLTRAEHADLLAAGLRRRSVRPLPSAMGRLPVLRVLARSQRISNVRLRGTSTWRPAVPSAREGWSVAITGLGPPR